MSEKQYVSNVTGVAISEEEYLDLDQEFRYYVYDETVLTSLEEHIRDTDGDNYV